MELFNMTNMTIEDNSTSHTRVGDRHAFFHKIGRSVIAAMFLTLFALSIALVFTDMTVHNAEYAAMHPFIPVHEQYGK